MRVLIVENQPERLAMLVPALEAAGCVVTATLNSARSLDVQIQALRPDVVIIAQDSPDRDTLEHVCVANQDCPRPIVMFTGDGSPDSIRQYGYKERMFTASQQMNAAQAAKLLAEDKDKKIDGYLVCFQACWAGVPAASLATVYEP